MKIVDPSFEFMYIPDGEFVLSHLEAAARTCYKSEDKITPESAKVLLKRVIKSGHESVLEHTSITVRIICDRGVTHELVRHRLCSFSQVSTRYVNYHQDKFGREITVIRPFFWSKDTNQYMMWVKAMQACETTYMWLIENGASAQEARTVLPNSLMTEIVVSTNIREWRHIFKLRCDKAAHPQMRQVMIPMLLEFNNRIPLLFEDIAAKYKDQLKDVV